MSVIILLILASLLVGLAFLGAFIWSVRSGQYEDTLTPSMRVLVEDDFIKTREKADSVPALNQNLDRRKTENL